MSTRQQLERVLEAVDGSEYKAAIVILVDADDEVETAAKGIDNDKALFAVLYAQTMHVAAAIYAELPEAQRKQVTLAYPSLEEARRLGLHVQRNGRN